MIKEKIKLTNAIVEKDYIKINNEHTNFCRRERVSFPNINELEKEVKQLRKELKEKGVKLIRTNTLKTLRENKQEYNDMVSDYNNTFDEMVAAWSYKLKEGLYVGYGSDQFYNEELKAREFKLQNMFNRSSILNKVLEIQSNVNRIKEELRNGTDYIKISV